MNTEPSLETNYSSPQSYEAYLETIKKNTIGLFSEGLSAKDLEKAEEDPRTLILTLWDGGKEISWPLTTPITNHHAYADDFFDTHAKEGTANTYYLSLPPKEHLQTPDDEAMIGNALYGMLRQNTLLVYEELDGQQQDEEIKRYLALVSDDAIEVEPFIDPKNNTPAAAHIFSIPIRPRHDEAASQQAEDVLQEALFNTHLLGPEELNDELIETLWAKVYEPQFAQLSENTPTDIKMSRDEFEFVLKHPAMRTIVHFDNDEPVAAATLALDIKACNRLNEAFYEAAYPNETLIYLLWIASTPDRKGAMHSMDIVKLIAQLTAIEKENMRMLYSCTNVSTDYIRRIAERTIRKYDQLADAEVEEIGKYNYRGVRLGTSTAHYTGDVTAHQPASPHP